MTSTNTNSNTPMTRARIRATRGTAESESQNANSKDNLSTSSSINSNSEEDSGDNQPQYESVRDNGETMRMDEILGKIRRFKQRGAELGIPEADLLQLFTMPRMCSRIACRNSQSYFALKRYWRRISDFVALHSIAILVLILALVSTGIAIKLWSSSCTVSQQLKCIKYNAIPVRQLEMTRPRMTCAMCVNLTEVPVVRDISVEDFDRDFAYTGVPLVVKGAASNWRAAREFNLTFLKHLYLQYPNTLTIMDRLDCFFVPYKAEDVSFSYTLKEFFEANSDEDLDRLNHKDGWYIGWQHCERKEMNFDDYYEWPYFINASRITPGGAEPWFFVGAPGQGVGIHSDYVGYPTWQAQLQGRKSWTLIPNEECLDQCHTLHFTLEPGDMLVVDTDLWYHATHVQPGMVSFTIGQEFK